MEHRCCGSWETNRTNLIASCYEAYPACPMTAVRMAEGGKMQKQAKWTTEEIQLALFQDTSSTMGLREASRTYGVPVSTLKRHLDKQNKFPPLGNDAPPGSVITGNDSGCMTQEKFLEWLQHFINTVRPSVENKVLLILDGHSSHTGSLAAIDLARENGVVMLGLPPHTTNKLQPLDVSFFRPLKTHFLQAQETWLRNNPGPPFRLLISSIQPTQKLHPSQTLGTHLLYPFSECADRDQCNPCSSQQPSTSRQGSSSGRTGQHPSAATNSSRPQHTADKPVRGKRPRREKQNESDIPVLTDSESDAEETLYSVIRTNPDGRCFLRSVCIGLDKRLQRAERDENGFVTDPVLKVPEQLAADELRAKT
ncbi:hypothetical protein BaRGS_00037583, partial [Batillaria attramentaria]